MMDLLEKTGIPISLEKASLKFRSPLKAQMVSQRSIGDMRDFLKEREAFFGKKAAYYMYRTVCLPQHRALFEKEGLRYDITVLESGLIGKEFVKTIGHHHPKKTGTDSFWPEVYEVIKGKALYLIQKPSGPGRIGQAFLIECAEGEKAIMLPGFGHVTINPLNRPLVVANIVSDKFESVYGDYRKNRGACYYIVESEGKITEVKNNSYKKIPPLLKAKPKELPELGLEFSRPLYSLFTQETARFRWLSSPEIFGKELKPENCFIISPS